MATKDYKVGYKKPPVERQFGKTNGNKRREGFWDISATPRFKLEQMMKLPRKDLLKVIADESASYFERKIAKCLVKGDWKTVESMINQVYGMPKQSVETVDLTPPKPLSPRKVKDDKSKSK